MPYNKNNKANIQPPYMHTRPYYPENGYGGQNVRGGMPYGAAQMPQGQQGAGVPMAMQRGQQPNHQLFQQQFIQQQHMQQQQQQQQQQQAQQQAGNPNQQQQPPQQQPQQQQQMGMAGNGPVQGGQGGGAAAPTSDAPVIGMYPGGQYVQMSQQPRGFIQPGINGYQPHGHAFVQRMPYPHQAYLQQPYPAQHHQGGMQPGFMLPGYRMPPAQANIFLPPGATAAAAVQTAAPQVKPVAKERKNAIKIINPNTNEEVKTPAVSGASDGAAAQPKVYSQAAIEMQRNIREKIQRQSESHDPQMNNVAPVPQEQVQPEQENHVAVSAPVEAQQIVPAEQAAPVPVQPAPSVEAPVVAEPAPAPAPAAVPAPTPIPDMSVPPPTFMQPPQQPCVEENVQVAEAMESALPVEEAKGVEPVREQAVEATPVPELIEEVTPVAEEPEEKSSARPKDTPVEPVAPVEEVVPKQSADPVPSQNSVELEPALEVVEAVEKPVEEPVKEASLEPKVVEEPLPVKESSPTITKDEVVPADTPSKTPVVEEPKAVETPEVVVTSENVASESVEAVSTPALVEEEIEEVPEVDHRDSNGRLVYDRKFMLSLRETEFAKVPPTLPDNLHMLKRTAGGGGGHGGHGRSSSMMNTQTHDFSPRYMSGGGGMGGIGSSSMVRIPHGQHHGGSMKGRSIGGVRKVIEAKVSTTKALKTVENAWKPGDNKNVSDKEKVLKILRGMLNKVSPETLDKLQVKIKDVIFENESMVEDCAELMQQKATLEKYFAPLYSSIVSFIIQSDPKREVKSSIAHRFKTHLLTLCDTEFRKIKDEETSRLKAEATLKQKLSKTTDAKVREDLQNAYDEKYKDKEKEARDKLMAEIDACKDEDKKKELQAEYDTLEEKHRRKSVGLVTFYGQLYLKNILQAAMVMKLIVKLAGDVHIHKSAEVLCSLFVVVGLNLYKTSDKTARKEIVQCVQEMKRQAQKEKDKRIKFMLLNVTELYDNNFVAKHKAQTVAGPSTKAEVKSKMENEELQIERNINNSTHNSGGNFNRHSNDRGFRRGDRGSTGLVSGNTSNWDTISKEGSSSASKPRPLKLVSTNSDELNLGPASGFSKWGRGSTGGGSSQQKPQLKISAPPSLKTSSRFGAAFGDDDDMDALRPGGRNNNRNILNRAGSTSSPFAKAASPAPVVKKPEPTPEPVEEVSDEKLAAKFNSCFEEYLNVRDLKEAAVDVRENIKVVNLAKYVNHMLCKLPSARSTAIKQLSEDLVNLLKHLSTSKLLTEEILKTAFQLFMNEYDDNVIDAPKLGDYVAEVIAQLVLAQVWSLTTVYEAVKEAYEGKNLVLMVLKRLNEMNGKMYVWNMFLETKLTSKSLFNPRLGIDAVYEKLCKNGISFLLDLPYNNGDDKAAVETIQKCGVNMAKREEAKNLMIACVLPVAAAAAAAKNAESISYEDRFDAMKLLSADSTPERLADIEMNAVFAMQAVCSMNSSNSPNIQLLADMFEDALACSLVSVDSFVRWSNSDEEHEPNLGRCVTGTRPLIREFQVRDKE